MMQEETTSNHSFANINGNNSNQTTRREFIATGAAVGAGTTIGLSAMAQNSASTPLNRFNRDAPPDMQDIAPLPMTNTGSDQIPRRQFGRHNDQVSIIGMGGHHLGDAKDVDEAVQMVQTAIDGGINFFDNCWEYNNGRSEDWMGRGLKGRRDKVFLMSKVCTHGRSGKLGLQMLEESLRRLQTDHLDLWQIHGVTYDNDPALAYAKGGIIEAMQKAKQQGKVRYLGFTGHKDPGIHFEMIRRGFAWDSVQMPLNPFDANFFSFQRQVVPEALHRGIAVLGMKPMGGTAESIKRGLITPEELLRYAMSLPVATTISGIESLQVLRQNLAVARGFQPLSTQEMQKLRERCAADAADGHLELYKSTTRYDAAVGRQQHGFPDEEHLPA